MTSRSARCLRRWTAGPKRVSTSYTFASFVPGYQDLEVGNVASKAVSGLSANTPYYYRVRAVNAGGTSGNSNTITAATNSGSGVTFTDDPLTPGVTPIKAVHIAELQTAIDTLRLRHGLGAFAWTDATLTSGVTVVKAVHLTELRAALNAVYVAASQPPPTYTTPVIIAGATPVTAAHFAELRAAVRAIW